MNSCQLFITYQIWRIVCDFFFLSKDTKRNMFSVLSKRQARCKCAIAVSDAVLGNWAQDGTLQLPANTHYAHGASGVWIKTCRDTQALYLEHSTTVLTPARRLRCFCTKTMWSDRKFPYFHPLRCSEVASKQQGREITVVSWGMHVNNSTRIMLKKKKKKRSRSWPMRLPFTHVTFKRWTKNRKQTEKWVPALFDFALNV